MGAERPHTLSRWNSTESDEDLGFIVKLDGPASEIATVAGTDCFRIQIVDFTPQAAPIEVLGLQPL